MPSRTFPRAHRRRSLCPSWLCILVIAWAVMMVGSNVARVLMLPDFFVRVQEREVVPKSPNYYEILGLDPLVDDSTLRQMRKKLLLEMHPVSKRSLLHSLAPPFLVESIHIVSFLFAVYLIADY